MSELLLNAEEIEELGKMIRVVEEKVGNYNYEFDPGFATYSCSCTAHKKSCGWD